MDLDGPVVELRQYTLRPGGRDALVRVFGEHFLEGQERHGMRILGQFRDRADPDRFVWIRAFADMQARARAIEEFYSGPLWAEHGPAANATMLDHTNVLLLKPAAPHLAFRFDPRLRPPPDAAETPGGVIAIAIAHLAGPVSPAIVRSLCDVRAPGTLLARLVTEPARWPATRLPVREDASVFVTVSSHSSVDGYRRSPAAVAGVAHEEHLLLEPTRRSFLRHRP